MKDDIIRMAREAGLRSAVILHLYGGKEGALCDSEIEELAQIERFFHMAQAAEREVRSMRWDELIAKAVEAEREACAKLCEDKNTLLAWPTYAAAIRARGQA
jgi:hypothetical protein